MKEKISVTDIAKKANVSRTTVMNVLNGNYEKMKKETSTVLQVFLNY